MELLEKVEKKNCSLKWGTCLQKSWSSSSLATFSRFLVMPMEGFKVWILALLRRMKLRKELKGQAHERRKSGFKI